jgi:Flp pilus assembly protein TadD
MLRNPDNTAKKQGRAYFRGASSVLLAVFITLQSSAFAQPDPRTLDPMIHVRLARKLTGLKKYHEALQEVNKALTLDSQCWDAMYQGAYIFQLEGRKQEAYVKYKALLNRKPDYLDARINLGSLYRQAGRFKDAQAEYQKVIDANFYSFDAHYNMANLLIDDNQLEEAIKELRTCVKLAPANGAAHNNLGAVFQRGHYLEEAQEEFEKASNLEPANKRYFENLEMVRSELKNKKTEPDVKTGQET